jgi:hypothetical protein
MRLQSAFSKVTLAAVVLCSPVAANAQEVSQAQTIVTLSEPVRTTLYPEIMCPHCIVPSWDWDYLLHLEIDKDPALVSMYDRDGKQMLEAHFKPPNAVSASVGAAGATRSGGILAVGGTAMNNGSIRKFIAETDSTGHVVELITMGGAFTPRQVCESPDGTIWALGYDLEFRQSPDANKNVLRHYKALKGMVASFIAIDSIGSFPNSFSQIANPGRSYLHCGQERVSVYFGPAALYVEVDASSGRMARWNVDMSSVVGSKTHGFAVTDEGRVFVAFANDPDANGERKHGLYELKATPGSPIASLTAVDGTVTAFDSYNTVPDGTFLRLWGADGNSLVVSRKGDDQGLCWVRVLVKEN